MNRVDFYQKSDINNMEANSQKVSKISTDTSRR